MNAKCQSCRVDDGVVYVEFGKRLFCGFCYLAWTMTLGKSAALLDVERKIRRVRRAA